MRYRHAFYYFKQNLLRIFCVVAVGILLVIVVLLMFMSDRLDARNGNVVKSRIAEYRHRNRSALKRREMGPCNPVYGQITILSAFGRNRFANY